jgi:glucokinase
MKEPVSVGRPSHLRHTNALTILRLLRESGSCSRADLVRASGLSAPTVTNVVSDLLAANLIKALGEGESSGGRPPDLIRFHADRGCLLAVEIKSGFLAFLMTDLSGVERERSRVSLEGQKTTPEAICQLIRLEIRRLLRKRKLTRDKLMVLVVAVPAIANVDEGIVVSVSTLEDWRNVPLRSMLRKVVSCLVVIENDTNLAALGERYRGAARMEESFTLMDIGANVSAGIVLGGRVHHGAQWSAGEIAYLRVPKVLRKPPALHAFGELERVLTSSDIVECWRDGHSESMDVGQILDLAQSGDEAAREIIDERAAIVADVMINLALILNPGLILLGGVVGSHPAVLESVLKEVERSEFAIPRIAAATLGEFAVLWGAIAAALEEIPLVLLPLPGGRDS